MKLNRKWRKCVTIINFFWYTVYPFTHPYPQAKTIVIKFCSLNMISVQNGSTSKSGMLVKDFRHDNIKYLLLFFRSRNGSSFTGGTIKKSTWKRYSWHSKKLAIEIQRQLQTQPRSRVSCGHFIWFFLLF